MGRQRSLGVCRIGRCKLLAITPPEECSNESGTRSMHDLVPLSLLRPEGLEPPTPGSEDRYSIQLSYGRMARNQQALRACRCADEFRCTRLMIASALRGGLPWECCDGSPTRVAVLRHLARALRARGGATGFEPATPRTTTWCANRLRHAPHVLSVRPGGFEPPASGLEGRCSVL